MVSRAPRSAESAPLFPVRGRPSSYADAQGRQDGAEERRDAQGAGDRSSIRLSHAARVDGAGAGKRARGVTIGRVEEGSAVPGKTNGLVVALTCIASAGACAQGAASFPAKPIRVIVPYPPGGGTDMIGRPLAQRLTESLKQQVIVDNRGGAGGNIGMELAAKSPPDGYTLVLALTAQ